jgi:hypothetical protein
MASVQPPWKPEKRAQRNADQLLEDHDDKGNRERNARTVEDTRKQITAQVIHAQQVKLARAAEGAGRAGA